MNTNNAKQHHSIPYIWLGVFAHPDDETSASAGTMVKWIAENNEAYVITATGGELGTLGTGDLVIQRENLASVRESELRNNLALYGCHSPFLLRYRDQELAIESTDILSAKVLNVIKKVQPHVIVTFGPSGISNHTDHIAIHHATKQAYEEYKSKSGEKSPILIYPSLSEETAKQYSLNLSSAEKRMDIVIDINSSINVKIEGLRNYKSQEDAQEFAKRLNDLKDDRNTNIESFSVSSSTPNDWQNYPVVDYLKNL